MIVQPALLTPEAFAPYGQVLMARNPLPERQEWAAQTDNLRPDASPNITYMSLEPSHYPIVITELERHPYSHQMFVPLEGAAHLVLVCPSHPDGNPDYTKALAFAASGGQSVNYSANVWHAPRTILHEPGAFIMLRWDNRSAHDTEMFSLPEPITVAPGR